MTEEFRSHGAGQIAAHKTNMVLQCLEYNFVFTQPAPLPNQKTRPIENYTRLTSL